MPIRVIAPTPTTGVTVDWRTEGVVTGVKNQGTCSADYAFSATGAIEGAWGIKKGQLVSLSEQQLIDCAAANDGCQGGSPISAIEYVIAQHGITTESAYPYMARDGTCKSWTAAVTISSLVRPQPGDEAALKTLVLNEGPVSVVLRIRSSAWESYTRHSALRL